MVSEDVKFLRTLFSITFHKEEKNMLRVDYEALAAGSKTYRIREQYLKNVLIECVR